MWVVNQWVIKEICLVQKIYTGLKSRNLYIHSLSTNFFWGRVWWWSQDSLLDLFVWLSFRIKQSESWWKSGTCHTRKEKEERYVYHILNFHSNLQINKSYMWTLKAYKALQHLRIGWWGDILCCLASHLRNVIKIKAKQLHLSHVCLAKHETSFLSVCPFIHLFEIFHGTWSTLGVLLPRARGVLWPWLNVTFLRVEVILVSVWSICLISCRRHISASLTEWNFSILLPQFVGHALNPSLYF